MRPAFVGLRSGIPNPVVLGRKFCPQCGRWRPISDYGAQVQRGQVGLRSWCGACQRKSNRLSIARRTLEQITDRREYHRIWQEGKRRRAGIPQRNWTRALPPEAIYLPPQPLLDAMDGFVNGQDDGWEALARASGIHQRQMFRLRTGESTRVRLDVADKLAVAMNIPLALLYPED